MNYSREWLIEQRKSGARMKFVFFWGHQPSKDGQLTATCFSHWWPSSFVLDDVTYKTAEHFMMAEKARLFGDENVRSQIIGCNKPAEAKELGRTVVNFDEQLWNQHRYETVVRGNVAKFSQNIALKEYLLQTNDRVLVEASPVDAIWGIGHAADHANAERPELWRGMNLLGFALMEARDIIRG